MASGNTNDTILYEPEESCPPLTAAITGFQLVVVVIALVVIPVVIVVRTAGLPPEYLRWTVFASLIVCGVATIFNSLKLGRFGTGHILVIGTAEPAIAICITALMQGGPVMMATLIVLSSLLKFFVAARLSLFRRIITPVVSGTVLMLIAATVILAVFGILTEVPEGKSVSPLAAPIASAVTLFVIAFMLLRSPRSLQIWSPLIGIVVGSLVSLPFGLYDIDLVQRVRWVGISPNLLSVWPGFDFTPGIKFWALLPAFLLIMVITSFKAVSDTSAIQRVSRNQPRATDFRLIQGGLHTNALANLASGLLGTIPTMTASPSVAMVTITRVAARSAGVWAGAIIIAMALLPKTTALLIAIPSPVAAAYIMIIMGLVFIEGVQTVSQDGIDHRKAIVVAVSFWVGMGFQNQSIFTDLLSGTWDALLSNSVTSGGVTAALLIAFVELTSARRKRLEVDLDQSSMPQIDQFMQDFAANKHWDEPSTQRLRAIGEETVSIMSFEEEMDTSGKQRRLIISAQMDEDMAELEFMSAAYDVDNLEDRLAYLNDEPEVSDEIEVSYRLLRYYAKSIRHQKFHDIDVITVQVEGVRAR
ncbi:MAG: hypothetical protein F4Y44_10240 [Chloroflexi bacterium]|nr:hypothetical protein [Chloroflexota bacterium]